MSTVVRHPSEDDTLRRLSGRDHAWLSMEQYLKKPFMYLPCEKCGTWTMCNEFTRGSCKKDNCRKYWGKCNRCGSTVSTNTKDANTYNCMVRVPYFRDLNKEKK